LCFSIGIAAQEPIFAKVGYTLKDEEVLSEVLIYASYPTNQPTMTTNCKEKKEKATTTTITTIVRITDDSSQVE